ncbi:hypothetical protein VL04_08065 [Chromobacterium violaceum]|nr:hypothetical protein VK93_06675 [Chromobacterium violaceum]KMN87697.1 hypothetical protein VL02_03255 [Chromobacterium violaceum]KMN90785.1 hypothetical protein VL04_08065 [Chromobacterium violaceum]KMO03172.1 hypothetical protein VL16_14750 [Chromobacterium violaceum]
MRRRRRLQVVQQPAEQHFRQFALGRGLALAGGGDAVDPLQRWLPQRRDGRQIGIGQIHDALYW